MIVYCNPNYTGRQEVMRLIYELREVKEHLIELSELDPNLRGTDEYCSVICKINSASDYVHSLRRIVTTDTVAHLIDRRVDKLFADMEGGDLPFE